MKNDNTAAQTTAQKRCSSLIHLNGTTVLTTKEEQTLTWLDFHHKAIKQVHIQPHISTLYWQDKK